MDENITKETAYACTAITHAVFYRQYHGKTASVDLLTKITGLNDKTLSKDFIRECLDSLKSKDILFENDGYVYLTGPCMNRLAALVHL